VTTANGTPTTTERTVTAAISPTLLSRISAVRAENTSETARSGDATSDARRSSHTSGEVTSAAIAPLKRRRPSEE